MSTKEILQHLERMGWAAIYIDGIKLGPGRDNWRSALQQTWPDDALHICAITFAIKIGNEREEESVSSRAQGKQSAFLLQETLHVYAKDQAARSALQSLTLEQHATLVEKIERFEILVSQEKVKI